MPLRDYVRGKALAYKRTFAGERDGAKVVLSDLASFCHAQKTVHVIGDTHGTAQLEGRRQVWLRIAGYLALSDAQINQIREEVEQE